MPLSYLVCAPTHLEARSLRRGLGPAVVRRTGAGRRRSEAAATSTELLAAGAVAVAGIAGALDPELAPGDVVVATEVRRHGERGTDRVIPCPSAPLLAAALRRSGQRVVTGPVVSTDHLVTGQERAELHRTGALAVDMESAWLLGPSADGGTPACVRVIADPATRPILRPATVGHLRTALRTLATISPALAYWGGAVRPRRVLLASPRSFCAGVERAIDIVERVLDQRGAPVYVRKQIVHNAHVVRGLEARGAVFVDELDQVPDGATVVFSAHGVAPSVRAEADDRGLAVVDATCPLVAKVHSEARRFADRGDTVLFIGHAGHEETEGTMGERAESMVLVEDLEAARSVDVPDANHVSYLVQTTLAVDEVDEILHALHERFPNLQAPGSDDICYATTNRQHALRSVAHEADVVLVVGSRNSSNSNRLVETATRMGTPAHLIDDASEIDLDWLAGAATVAVTAGASAPTSLVDEVVQALRGLGPVDLYEREVTREDIRFTLPKEVR
ncbi:4-hydroxy-3-methylbut-2-enyl diphosphate reductase [Actinopolymorpha alba]|uniref:4-hydroxy-3-methylbut-2-enyl diphosphate reductase n=1 Tax=Actinopolymorpha alba TaxID=533267 RepID=UPI00035E3E65|nr:4-hydroxy-3-methylbut-2-enyl diphosphate reductase [Actinopolymorpha alba]